MESAAPDFRFPAALRLKRSGDFQRVYDNGRRSGDAHLLLFGCPILPVSHAQDSVSPESMAEQFNAID
jgi:hypothetical protein